MPIIESSLVHPHGTLVRSEAIESGITRRVWQGMHSRGELLRTGPGVSRLSARPMTALQRVESAVLALGGSSVAAGPTAASLWLGTPPSTPIHVIVPRRTSARMVPDVVVHRPRVDADLRSSTVERIRATNPLRALVDTAAWQPSDLEDVLTRMLRRGLVSTSAIRSLVERHSRQGHPGVRELRQRVGSWPADAHPESVLEVRMLELIRGHGLPTPTAQHRIGPYRVDLAWPQWKAAAECDGREFHGDDRFESDRERDLVLASLGWVVWRFTWHQVTRRESWVAEQLRRALTERGAAAA